MKASKQKGNRLLVRAHYFMALIFLFHTIFFIAYWLSVGRFKLDVDQFVSAQIGLSLPYTTILIGLYSVLMLWSLVRFIRLRLAIRSEVAHSVGRDLVYAIIWLVAMLGVYLSFYFVLQQEPSQKGVLIHLLNLARLVSDAVIFLFAAIWLRRLVLFLTKNECKQAPQSGKWPWTVLIGLVSGLAGGDVAGTGTFPAQLGLSG